MADLPERGVSSGDRRLARSAARGPRAGDAGEGARLGAGRPGPGDARDAGRRCSEGPLRGPCRISGPSADPGHSGRADARAAAGQASRSGASPVAATGRPSTRPRRSTRRCGSSSAPRRRGRNPPRSASAGTKPMSAMPSTDDGGRGRTPGPAAGPGTRPREGSAVEGGSGTMTAMRAGLPALLLILSLAVRRRPEGPARRSRWRTGRSSPSAPALPGDPPEERLASARARHRAAPEQRGPIEQIATHPLQLGRERGTAV